MSLGIQVFSVAVLLFSVYGLVLEVRLYLIRRTRRDAIIASGINGAARIVARTDVTNTIWLAGVFVAAIIVGGLLVLSAFYGPTAPSWLPWALRYAYAGLVLFLVGRARGGSTTEETLDEYIAHQEKET